MVHTKATVVITIQINHVQPLLYSLIAENLEAKMKWLKNYERVQQIQQQIIWQPITELDPRAFIPEVLLVNYYA